ncbi:MAG: HlyD family secretion protein [Francisellaceae bacterium]
MNKQFGAEKSVVHCYYWNIMNIDTIIEDKKKRSFLPIVFACIGILFFVVFVSIYMGDDVTVIEKSQVMKLTLKQGDLPKIIKAYGKLRSKNSRLLTAASSGTIEEVLQYPGEKVNSDTIILRLTNNELTLLVNEAKTELDAKASETEEFRLLAKLAEMENIGEVQKLKLEISDMEMMKDAKKHLFEKGIVPEYEYKIAESELNKNKLMLTFLKDKISQLEFINGKRLNIRLKQVKQQEMKLKMQQELLTRSNLRAQMDGILQELLVEVGQSVITGDKLAVVGSTKELIAEISIQQREAGLIEVNDEVIFNTYGSEGTGKVVRINPVVNDGRVLVEVQLTGKLPNNARPELTVQASISIDTLNDVLYIKRNDFFTPNSKLNLFILDKTGKQAHKKLVHFGEEVGDFIIVKRGLKANDKIVILSDIKKLKDIQKYETLRIDNE